MLKPINWLTFFSCITLIAGCDEELSININEREHITDTIPHIILWGKKTDTAYLYANYEEPGSEIRNAGKPMDCSAERANINGTVNTRIPGMYYVYYSFTDKAGRAAKTLTRTVQVVENEAGFLNGTYDVVCTFTAITRGANKKTISTTTYTATIFPENKNRQFRLVPLHLGAEYIVPNSQLSGDSMYMGYFTPDYYTLDISCKLSTIKTSFTVESKAIKYSPAITYHCKNVFTKQFVLKSEKSAAK